MADWILIPALAVTFIVSEGLVLTGLLWLLSSQRASSLRPRIGHLLLGQCGGLLMTLAVVLLAS